MLKKTILSAIAIVALSIAILTAYFYLLCHGLASTKTSFQAKVNELFSETMHIDNAFVGSSRTYNHIDPFIIDKNAKTSSYNFGLSAANMAVYELVVGKILQRKHLPKKIIFNIDNYTFESRHNDKIFYYPIYFPYLKDTLTQRLANVEPNIRYSTYYPFYGVSLLDDYLKNIAWDGIINPQKTDEIYQHRGFEAIVENNFKGDDQFSDLSFQLDTSEIIAFEKLCATITKKNIAIVLVMAPLYKNRNADNESTQQFYSLIEKLKTKYHCKTIDCFLDTRFDKSKFYNNTHLNKNGAILFSEMIADSLIENHYNQ